MTEATACRRLLARPIGCAVHSPLAASPCAGWAWSAGTARCGRGLIAGGARSRRWCPAWTHLPLPCPLRARSRRQASSCQAPSTPCSHASSRACALRIAASWRSSFMTCGPTAPRATTTTGSPCSKRPRSTARESLSSRISSGAPPSRRRRRVRRRSRAGLDRRGGRRGRPHEEVPADRTAHV